MFDRVVNTPLRGNNKNPQNKTNKRKRSNNTQAKKQINKQKTWQNVSYRLVRSSNATPDILPRQL